MFAFSSRPCPRVHTADSYTVGGGQPAGFSDSTGFWVGTAVYIALGVVACLVTNLFKDTRLRGQIGLTWTLITIATVCMWMMWAMTWLMQWHPLIAPEKDTSD